VGTKNEQTNKYFLEQIERRLTDVMTDPVKQRSSSSGCQSLSNASMQHAQLTRLQSPSERRSHSRQNFCSSVFQPSGNEYRGALKNKYI